MEHYCTPKSQYTTVKHSQQLFEHTYTSDLYGLGTLNPIEFFQQDLLWQSSNIHSHSCSHKASKHTRSIRRRAIGPLAHHNGTSAHSPSLACHLPAPTTSTVHGIDPRASLTVSPTQLPTAQSKSLYISQRCIHSDDSVLIVMYAKMLLVYIVMHRTVNLLWKCNWCIGYVTKET
jgi:hypothetical protein